MQKSILTRFVISVCCVLLLSSCAQQGTKEIEDQDLVSASYTAADALAQKATENGYSLFKEKPILVASFVNVDDVRYSSTFGRMIAEQISSRLAQKGLKVMEVKLRDSLFIKEQTGELLLSREILDISKVHDAFAVVVGTYAEGKRTVYVTTKLVRADGNAIIGAYDYSLPVGVDTRQLLRDHKQHR